MFDCILLCAGKGRRTKLTMNKVLYEVMGKPLYQYSLDCLLNINEIRKILLVVNEDDYNRFDSDIKNTYKKDSNRIELVIGGDERWDSVYNGLLRCNSEVCVIHDGARPLIKEQYVLDVYNSACINHAAIVAVKVKDTIKVVDDDNILNTLDRNRLYQAQTPQAVNKNMMIKGLDKLKFSNDNIYDDVMVFEKIYKELPKIVMGDYNNIKVTTEEDLDYVKYLLNRKNGVDMSDIGLYRIGHSNDVHKLVKGRKLILGGIKIDYEKGLLGHSDADCVLHVVSEAILGALGLGDLGMHFPDTSDLYLDMDSSYFVIYAVKKMATMGYAINNIDIIIYLEKPNMSKYKALIKENIAKLLNTSENNVNVKATRKEGLGYIGKEEAIEAECVVLLVRSSNL